MMHKFLNAHSCNDAAETLAVPEVERLEAVTLEEARGAWDFARLQAETAGLSLQELRKLLFERNERVFAPSFHFLLLLKNWLCEDQWLSR
jgi:hypothetical protein